MIRDALYLAHILACIARIAHYTAEGRAAFMTDEKTQDAVLRNLHTLAESTQRLSEAARAAQPDVDWRAIAGFRNVVVHDYLGVSLDGVWGIVADDLLVLASRVQQMQRRLAGDPPAAGEPG